MYDKDKLDKAKIFCTYDKLYLTEKLFCKITKSSEKIADKCMEHHFIKYPESGFVSDTNSDGHGYLSFIPFYNAVLAIPHGDTLILLETDEKNAIQFCKDIPVKSLGGSYEEYVAPCILVKHSFSLANVNISRFMIKYAKPQILFEAANPHFRFAKISKHFEKLGFTDAKLFWEEIERYTQIQLKTRHSNPIKIGNSIKREFGQRTE